MPSLFFCQHYLLNFLETQETMLVSWVDIIFELPGHVMKNVKKQVPEWDPEKSSGIYGPG